MAETKSTAVRVCMFLADLMWVLHNRLLAVQQEQREASQHKSRGLGLAAAVNSTDGGLSSMQVRALHVQVYTQSR